MSFLSTPHFFRYVRSVRDSPLGASCHRFQDAAISLPTVFRHCTRYTYTYDKYYAGQSTRARPERRRSRQNDLQKRGIETDRFEICKLAQRWQNGRTATDTTGASGSPAAFGAAGILKLQRQSNTEREIKKEREKASRRVPRLNVAIENYKHKPVPASCFWGVGLRG